MFDGQSSEIFGHLFCVFPLKIFFFYLKIKIYKIKL